MNQKNTLAKILAISGTVLVWLPVLAPLFFAIIAWFGMRRLHFDYLIPAELFPAVLVGGGVLLWAALRSRLHVKWIAWSFGSAVGVLVIGQVIAIVTGIASGRIEPIGLPWAAVVASLALYVLAVILLGVGGILLLRALFKPTVKTVETPKSS